MSSDAEHITRRIPTGSDSRIAIEAALKRAAIPPADVGYINPHATSTPQGDIAEYHSMKQVFGGALANAHFRDQIDDRASARRRWSRGSHRRRVLAPRSATAPFHQRRSPGSNLRDRLGPRCAQMRHALRHFQQRRLRRAQLRPCFRARRGGASSLMSTPTVFDLLSEAVERRILVLDGAMGTMIQRQARRGRLPRRALRRPPQRSARATATSWPSPAPTSSRASTRRTSRRAATSSRPTPSAATSIAQADYGLEPLVYEHERRARASGQAPRRTNGPSERPTSRASSAGAIGPPNRDRCRMSPDVNDPAFRAVTFDRCKDAYAEQSARPDRRRRRPAARRDDHRHAERSRRCMVAIEEVFAENGVAPAAR